jgi:hypothetical protein
MKHYPMRLQLRRNQILHGRTDCLQHVIAYATSAAATLPPAVTADAASSPSAIAISAANRSIGSLASSRIPVLTQTSNLFVHSHAIPCSGHFSCREQFV